MFISSIWLKCKKYLSYTSIHLKYFSIKGKVLISYAFYIKILSQFNLRTDVLYIQICIVNFHYFPINLVTEDNSWPKWCSLVWLYFHEKRKMKNSFTLSCTYRRYRNSLHWTVIKYTAFFRIHKTQISIVQFSHHAGGHDFSIMILLAK